MAGTTLVSFLQEPEKLTAWETGYDLHSFSLTAKDGGWLLVIRVNAKNGGRLVTFIGGNTVADCMETWFAAMTTTSIKLKWSKDKFA